MNKPITYLGILGIVGVVGVAAARNSLSTPTPDPHPLVAPVSQSFAEFPVGQPKTVEFRVDDPELDSLSAREQADQRRDWLLFTALRSSGLPVDSLDQATFDLPAARYGFMRGVGNFEYGETRSVYVGSGLVVALVPAGATPEQRLDDVGRVADRHRKDLGEIPDSVVVFEYSLGASGDSARLTRAATLRGSELFTSGSGYREARIATLEELAAFMRGIDDLTYARLDADVLVLGGRKVLASAYRGIDVEDVAALWQSEQKIQERRALFDARWKGEKEAFDARWSGRTYVTEAERLALQAEEQAEWDSLAFLNAKEAHDQGIVPGSGFSLDPTYDYDSLGVFFDRAAYPLAALSGVGGDSATIRTALAARDEGPFLNWLDAMRQGAFPEVAELILQGSGAFRFQAARYDGELRGTRVGMVLFYTDLLAKLWAIDFMGSAPGRDIRDFDPLTRSVVSPIYRRQLDSLNNTRLWFGPQDAAFQVGADENSLSFARGATRVYAASASSYTPGVEAPANARSEAFLGWWNDHYDEIARYEPEYQRLNEIMKWSLLVGWLGRSGAAERLGYLSEVAVDTTLWFPVWARSQPDLRFAKWDEIQFYPHDYSGSTTEALPMLFSAPYERAGSSHVLSGGVSLASRETFATRTVLSREVSPLLRRPTLDYGTLDPAGGELKTLEGLRYRLRALPGGGRSVVVSPATKTRFRGPVSELASTEVERTFAIEGRSLHAGMNTGEMPLGRLDIGPSGGGIQVAWHGRDVADAQSLARRMSASRDVDALVSADARVAAAYRLDDGHLVQFEGSDRWVKIVSAGDGSVEVPAGFDARVAAYQGRPRLLHWLDEAGKDAELAGARAAVLKEPGTSPLGFRLPAGGPPPRELHTADRFLAAHDYRSALEELDRLPPAYRDVPEVAMRRAVADLDLSRPEAAAAALREAAPLTPANRQAFFDQVNAWAAADPAQRHALDQVARTLDGMHASAAGTVDGTLTPVVEADRLALHYARRAPLMFVVGGRRALRDLEEGRALLYVQDSPGLNNLDFSPGAIQRTLHEVVTGRRGTLQELPRSELGHFRPSQVYAAAEPRTRYRLRTDVRSGPPPPQQLYRPWTAQPDCEGGERDSQCPPVYVVTAS